MIDTAAPVSIIKSIGLLLEPTLATTCRSGRTEVAVAHTFVSVCLKSFPVSERKVMKA